MTTDHYADPWSVGEQEQEYHSTTYYFSSISCSRWQKLQIVLLFGEATHNTKCWFYERDSLCSIRFLSPNNFSRAETRVFMIFFQSLTIE